MNIKEIYNAWKEHKSEVQLREDFSDGVMRQVYRYEQGKGRSLFDIPRFVEFVSAHTFAKIAFVTTGAFAGFVRLVFMILAILNRGEIHG